MLHQFTRTALVYGQEAMEKLQHSRVLIFGIGGVGGHVVEALARSGIGTLGLVDDDRICLSNLNRQIIATHTTLGQYKVDAAQARIHDICPDIVVHKYCCFYLPETAESIDFTAYDYIVDAIDTVKGKLEIVTRAKALGIPVISSMGAGNKVDPTRFRIADIQQTRVCPLARIMRTELRRRGIESLKVVYSDEPPIRPMEEDVTACLSNGDCTPETVRNSTTRRSVPGSTAFVPSVVGLMIAGEIIQDITNFDPSSRRTGR